MRYEVVELDQDTEQWLEWRHTGIGGSDASTIMVENRFKSPAQLLYEKKNHIDEPANEAMAEGKRLEPHARTDYVKKTNNDVHPICLQSVERDERYIELLFEEEKAFYEQMKKS